MESQLFDRIARTLAGSSRRKALKTFAASGVAAVASRIGHDAAEAKKKRCRKRRQQCGGKKKCCNKSGLVRCQAFPTFKCKGFSGRHCCGVEGALCDPNASEFGNCDCCGDEFFCVAEGDEGRCRTEDT